MLKVSISTLLLGLLGEPSRMAKMTVTITWCQGDSQGQCLFEFEQNVGWDQRRFAASATSNSRCFMMVGWYSK